MLDKSWLWWETETCWTQKGERGDGEIQVGVAWGRRQVSL